MLIYLIDQLDELRLVFLVCVGLLIMAYRARLLSDSPSVAPRSASAYNVWAISLVDCPGHRRRRRVEGGLGTYEFVHRLTWAVCCGRHLWTRVSF